MPVNSQSPIIGNTFIGRGIDTGTAIKSGGMIPVRVVDISLSPSANGQSTFQNTKGWWGIGAIKFEPLTKGSIPKEYPQGSIAYPLNINYRNVPLINEIVYIILGPSHRRSTEGNSDALDFYYTSTLNIWNGVHLNPLPAPTSTTITDNEVQNSDVDAGIENNTDSQKQEPKFGKIFEENPLIRNLYPQEGDVIIEGRFGNSLRFTSTSPQPSGSKEIESPWSSFGKSGSPLTILRNGQTAPNLNYNNWFPIYENIQQDDSSIYLTSGQLIPVDLASTIFDSYGIDIVPTSDTTKRIQNVELEDPNVSNQEADSIDQPYDSVNVEPNLESENG